MTNEEYERERAELAEDCRLWFIVYAWLRSRIDNLEARHTGGTAKKEGE